MKKVLITGGAGFIGYNLCRKLLEDGCTVTSIDNYSTGTKQNEIKGVEYINYDICNEITDSLVGDIEIVYHLAASARIQPSFKNPTLYARNNVIGTFNVCDFCIKNKIPLIFAGSSSHHSGKYKNPYTFTKDLSEETVELYQKVFNLKASITRFYNVYGPHQLEEGNATLIGIWDKAKREKNTFTIYGDGSKRRDFTHVDDIVEALISIFKRGSWGHIFELGRGQNFSIKDVANMYDQVNIQYKCDRQGEAQNTLCDSSLAKNLLDWHPQKNLKDWIKK
jgi:UDP-glucose 4-epimerase